MERRLYPMRVAIRHALGAVRSFLVGIKERQPRTLIVSCLRDKALSEMAELLCPLFDHIISTQVNSPRAATLEELVVAFAAAGSETIETQPDAHAALARGQELTSDDGIIVGIGSFYRRSAGGTHLRT